MVDISLVLHRFFSLTPRALFAVVVTGATILLIPDDLAVTVAVDSFRNTHRIWIGPTTLLAFALLMSFVLWSLPRRFRAARVARMRKTTILQQLDSLSNEERLVLAFFMHSGSSTQYLWANFGPAQALCSKGLLRQLRGTGSLFSWPYVIPEFVWSEMNQRRDELFPGIDSDEARNVFSNFESFQRDFMLRVR